VGFGTNSPTTPGSQKALIAAWNGTTWSTVTSAEPGVNPTLNAISCFSATSCAAVGTFLPTTTSAIATGFEETWNGTSWTLLPDPANGIEFNGVSCLRAGYCLTAGDYTNGTRTVSLSSVYYDSTWFTLPTAPSNWFSAFWNMGCYKTSPCVAVGSTAASPPGVPVSTFAEDTTDGRTWNPMSTPDP
jgi:hypothetical protein